MPDQISGQNLDKTIDPKEFTDVPLVREEDQNISAHSVVPTTSSPTLNNSEGNGFPCDMCDKSVPNNKSARALHMQRMHNIKTLQSTPGPVRTRPSTKCNWCSYICKTKPSMSKHIDLFHKDKKELFDKDKKETTKQAPLKRQLTSFTCSKCNSTFDNIHRMKTHFKAQHEGKHALSPERKVAKQFQEEKDNKKGDNLKQEEIIRIDRNEYENLQDLLLQSGQENEKLKGTIREWVSKTENMSEEMKKAEDKKYGSMQ